MHKNGWRPFWAALGAALLVLLPLVGGTVLLTRQMVRTRIQTAQPQSGVPIQLPRAEHRMTLLLCTAGEQPGFLLVYLNAAQNSLNLLAVPGELTVPFNGETASLAHCYGAAGPARCRQALLEVLGLPEDMLYLALSPAVLEKSASRYGPVRVGFSGALTADELAETGLSAAVQSISAKEAHALLAGWDADGTLPDALRASSAALLTDFAAQDYTLLGTVLEFLANNSALPHAEALPGAWDAKAGTYTVTDASRAAVQTFLSVSPASGNDASLREP